MKIAPSILASDFSCLSDELRKIEIAGADMVHIDIMDGTFVPNISIGPCVVESIRKVTKLDFDVHLMIINPEKYINSFIDSGADMITFHVEATNHANSLIQMIKSKGKKVAVALNPATSLSTLDYLINDVDMVLLMTVNPGFGGQSYIDNMTEKIYNLKNIIEKRNLNVDIQVDGGIDLNTIQKVSNAGANIAVCGTAIFKENDTKWIIEELKRKSQR